MRPGRFGPSRHQLIRDLQRKPDVDAAVLGAGPISIFGAGEEAIVATRRRMRVVVTIARGLIIAAAVIVAVIVAVLIAMIVAMIIGAHRVMIVRAILRAGGQGGQSGDGKGCDRKQCGSE
jgi:hypothetical protein